MAAYLKIPTGVLIGEVGKDSPAERAGLLPYDIIVEFDGDKITDNADLQDALLYCAPGTTTNIVVMRQNNGVYTEVELQITLGNKPK
jgi:serine protease Do